MPATILASGPPSRRKARHPATDGSSSRPGTMNRSRPCSSAQAAVVSAPLRAPASTTTVASARPLMIRFRRGNVPRDGTVSGANSLTTAPPPSTMRRARPRWAAGYSRSCPPPITATVGASAPMAAAWAAPSIPIARPETTVAPRPATASAIRAAVLRPMAVGRRVPTIATARSRSIDDADPRSVQDRRGQRHASEPRRIRVVRQDHDARRRCAGPGPGSGPGWRQPSRSPGRSRPGTRARRRRPRPPPRASRRRRARTRRGARRGRSRTPR